MSDVLFTIRLPEELAAKAKAANVEIEAFLIDSLERKLAGATEGVDTQQTTNRMPTRAEVEAEIRQSAKRVESGKYPMRTLGLNKGTVWVSHDFDDPLPDEFWFGGDDGSRDIC